MMRTVEFAEKPAGIAALGAGVADVTDTRLIHKLFERIAAARPDFTAVVDGDKSLTYAEVNARANRLANLLRASGVAAGDLVAVSLDRSVTMAVGILAVLKAGGAYVPLDPGYPQDRLDFMLEDSRAQTLLTRSDLLGAYRNFNGSVLCTDSKAGEIPNASDANLNISAVPDALAYVIYTSGTTGRPKGVMISHENLCNYVETLPLALGLSPDERYLHTASMSFSSSVRQLMVPLSLGASVVIASSELMRDPAALFAFIKHQRVTVLDFVPSFWRSCLYALNAKSEDARRDLLACDVRLILSASEPLPATIPPALAAIFKPDVRMINMYGQTETAGIISFYPIENPSEMAAIVPIGKPIPNAQIHILNPDMSPVGDGESGELFVGGPGVGCGYLNQPELSSERFLNDDLSGALNARLYRTGDLARRLSSGAVEHLGRFDDQVKIRGFRVETAEVESVIAKFENVRESVVVARETSPGDMRLAAYLISQDKSPVAITELRTFLRSKLPDYMVPSSFVQLERFPLTPNGKIDRKNLPAPDAVTAAETSEVRLPETETQKVLAEIWSDLLGIERIGIDENFFDAGGHSLLAVRMFTSIEEIFHKNIPLATLFGAGTIEKLAAIIDLDQWEAPESSLVAIKPGGSRVPFYCMHAVGGNVLFYSDLAKYLDDEQPLYGLQARRLAGRQIGHATIEEMVEFYIQEIKKHQPNGPYCIGGSSFGGLVAYEMARQLHQRGDTVGLLALFDTSTPEYKKTLVPGTTGLQIRVHSLLDRIELHRDNLAMLGKKDQLKYVFAKAKRGIRKYRRNFSNSLKKLVRKMYAEFKGKRAIPKNYIHLENQLVNARKIFRPKPYPGRATLFRATNQPYGLAPEPTLGWSRYVGELEIREVPGHHTSIIAEPYVRGLARELTDRLALVTEENVSDDSAAVREKDAVKAAIM